MNLAELVRAWQSDGLGEGDEIRRVFVERPQREIAQPARDAGAEKLRATVDHMHRLGANGNAGVTLLEGFVGLFEPRIDFLERFGGKGSVHFAMRSSPE